MRVDTIDLYSNNILFASFDLKTYDQRNPYIVRHVTGLDADELVAQFYGQGSVTAKKYYDLVLRPREIVLRIGLNPKYNVGGTPHKLREDLYRAISSHRAGNVELRFNDNARVVGVIKGFITKFESSLFSKDTDVQITIKCDDPMIKSQYISGPVISELGSGPVFYFIDPISTSPHGFRMKVTFTEDQDGFSISDTTGDWLFLIDYEFLDGDELYLSSEFGEKYLYRIRSGGTLYLMDKLPLGTLWPVLFPGENPFDFSDPSAFEFNEVYWSETHWGV